MSLYSKVFSVLVTEGREATAKQLANWFNSTPAVVAARVSEVRSAGFAVYNNTKTDSKGRTASFYRVGKPTRAMVAAGQRALRG
jgi:transcription initiation factor IIE alpha subunit